MSIFAAFNSSEYSSSLFEWHAYFKLAVLRQGGWELGTEKLA